jgi:predicted nucleotidyltransferase component of viral defense system
MLDQNKHRTVLIKILEDIYSDSTLISTLAFKGGTAMYFIYELDRFSVDLDFDLLDPKQETEVYKKLQEILSKHGTIKSIANKRNSIQAVLSYSEEIQNIKIDISKRNFGSSYELKNLYGIAMQVMIKEDMFANKLIACAERPTLATRDLFDIYYMFNKLWNYNPKIIELRWQAGVEDLLETVIHRIEKLSPSNILSEIGALLNAKQQAWVKAKLISSSLVLLKQELASLKSRHV